MKITLTRLQISSAAAAIRRASIKRFGPLARAAVGREDLADGDYAALHAEVSRQTRIQEARAAARRMPPEFSHDLRWRLIIKQRKSALALLESEERAERKRSAAVRRAVQAVLRSAGYTLDHSGAGSNYYRRWNGAAYHTVRVSDHDVPVTAEREHNANNGGVSWAHREFINLRKFSSGPQAAAHARTFIGEVLTDDDA